MLADAARWTVLALAVRALLFVLVLPHPERWIRADSGDYLRLGANLAAGAGFSKAEAPPFGPETARTPVYPLFLAGLRILFGPSLVPVALAQILISAAACGLTYLLGLRLFSAAAARLGALLQVFCLGSILYSDLIMTETLFSFLLLGMLAGVARGCAGAGRRWFVAAGILGGVAILCRPIALLFPVILAVAMMDADWRGRETRASAGGRPEERTRRRTRLVPVLLMLSAAAAVVLPWIARNQRVLGRPAVSSLDAYNLLYYEAAPLEARVEHAGEDEIRAELARSVETDLPRAGSLSARDRAMRGLALRIIREHPVRFVEVHLQGCLPALLVTVG